MLLGFRNVLSRVSPIILKQTSQNCTQVNKSLPYLFGENKLSPLISKPQETNHVILSRVDSVGFIPNKFDELIIASSIMSRISCPSNQPLPTHNKYNIDSTEHGKVINEGVDVLDVFDEPNTSNQTPLYAHKSDIRWRRRRMRRHRLLKWRKKYKHLVKLRLKQKLERRKVLLDNDLVRMWEMYGLKKEPPALTPEEKSKLVRSWEEEGIWTNALTKEEIEKYIRAQKLMYLTDRCEKL
nr:uncharacterized protein LOC100185126 [Ciona intestinalis]|eukprot:XP_002127961.1 uncharacterized protein LOC100185126 [Ciona intestinalis]